MRNRRESAQKQVKIRLKGDNTKKNRYTNEATPQTKSKSPNRDL